MAAVIKAIVSGLVDAFAGLLLFTIMFAGLTIMFKPEQGREVLKNCVIAALLFVLGLLLARACL